MAAGLGFKTFTTGEVLTAGDVNGYLMQGINVFASSAARASAITSPQEGQYSYLKDTNSTEYYDGAAWIAAPIGDITGVTAGVGITGGGTSGTVTITNDMATTITASGDIVVGTGSGTYDNLPIGTTGQVLTADTTVSPYKVKWATAATATVPILTIAKPTGDFSTTSNSFVDLTDATITRTPVSGTNKIEIKASFVLTTGSSQTLLIKCLAGATNLGQFTTYIPYNGAAPSSVTFVWYVTNNAASSTVFKLQVATGSSYSITIYGVNSGYNNVFSTLEVY